MAEEQDPKAGWCDACKAGEFGSCVMIPERGIKDAKCTNYSESFRAHPMAEMLTCAKCGTLAPLGTKFCSSCGTAFATVSNAGGIEAPQS